MTGHLPRAEKTLLADETVVGDFAMRQSMPVEGRFPRELDQTDWTFVLLGEVHSQVFTNRPHVLLLAEFTAVQLNAFFVDPGGVVRGPVVLWFTHTTLVMLLVHPQEGGRCKCSAAYFALVVSPTLVDRPYMMLVGVDRGQTLITHRTLITAAPLVNPRDMPLEFGLFRESFRAELAIEGNSVPFSVCLQRQGRRTHLTAQVTRGRTRSIVAQMERLHVVISSTLVGITAITVGALDWLFVHLQVEIQRS